LDPKTLKTNRHFADCEHTFNCRSCLKSKKSLEDLAAKNMPKLEDMWLAVVSTACKSEKDQDEKDEKWA